MGDSAPLPRIGGSRAPAAGGASRSDYSGEDFGLLASRKAENDRAAREAADFCFIGAGGRRAIRGANSADFRSHRGCSVNLADYGDFGSSAY
uniref:Protein of unassigned function n=1 Tax=Macrostomum lignano TaxID=282301 RepID=A0A1I8H8F5_9PLAT